MEEETAPIRRREYVTEKLENLRSCWANGGTMTLKRSKVSEHIAFVEILQSHADHHM